MSSETKRDSQKESKFISFCGTFFDFFSKLILVYRLPLAILIILVMFILLGFIIFIVFGKTNISLQVTNFGFAILLGIASVCFSWVRTFDSTQNKTAIRIRETGELSLLSSLLFLIASLLNYVISVFPFHNYSISIIEISSILKWIIFIVFLIAINIFLKVLARLLLILRKRYRSFEHSTHDEDVY